MIIFDTEVGCILESNIIFILWFVMGGGGGLCCNYALLEERRELLYVLILIVGYLIINLIHWVMLLESCILVVSIHKS